MGGDRKQNEQSLKSPLIRILKTMNEFQVPNLNYLWSSLVIEELIRQGVDYFCIAPGSRSAPLSVAAGINIAAKTCVHFDERGLAFHAVGYITATRKPAVLICTSGTAVANFLPAVIECAKKKLPLIIFTADRPPELRKTGANQTIEQTGIFGEYARWKIDVPCPDTQIPAANLLTLIDQAVYQAKRLPAGPVHLNFMFREPLAPIEQNKDFNAYLQPLARWFNATTPFTSYLEKESTLSAKSLTSLIKTISNIKNGLLVVGKLTGPDEASAVLQLGNKLGWPIFPDISSGLRLARKHPLVIENFDLLLNSHKWQNTLSFDGVLHLGGRMTSKRLNQFLEHKKIAPYIMVLNHPLRNDPTNQVTLRVESSVKNFCNALQPKISKKPNTAIVKIIQKSSRAVDKLVIKNLRLSGLNEPAVARILSQQLKPRQGLFLGNSLPIREFDMFAQGGGATPSIGTNRGASGIDGLIASASGFAKGLNAPTTLLIGDLSFLHDLNSLALLRSNQPPLIIVILNNDGGGIFSFLPIAQFRKNFEQLFGTPHGLKFSDSAKQFQLHYSRPTTPQEFIKAYRQALKYSRSTIIEITTNREQNAVLQRDLQEQIRNSLAHSIKEQKN